MSKKKKDKPKYDENGKWVDQDSRILSGIRRAYRLSPQMQETLKAARVELPPLMLKSGKPGKRVQVRYKCASCGCLFPQTKVQVDHISPATPLNKSVKDMTWDEVVKGIFCSVDNLQVLCSIPMSKNGGLPSCHAKKSAQENWIRKQIKKCLTEDPELSTVFNVVDRNVKIINRFKDDYKLYLVEKAEKLAAKEERKRIREEKKRDK